MQKLIDILNTLPRSEQAEKAARSGTSVGYLRKAHSAGQRLGDKLCANLEREFSGAVHCEDINPNIHWRRLPDESWPWHPEGRPVVDPAPEVVTQEAST